MPPRVVVRFLGRAVSGPWARTALVPVILPRLDGVVDKLTDGARVLDVGCGAGVAVEAIAQAFPNSSVEGVDLSLHAIERARERLADLPNAAARHGRAEDVADAAAYDLVLTFDCLHDMTRPDAAMTAVRRSVREDGTWLVKEIRCRPTWEQNRRNPMLAMFFGFSISACMASATSEPGGAALGTVGLHGELLESMARDAGFSRFTVHDVDDPANLYYEIIPFLPRALVLQGFGDLVALLDASALWAWIVGRPRRRGGRPVRVLRGEEPPRRCRRHRGPRWFEPPVSPGGGRILTPSRGRPRCPNSSLRPLRLLGRTRIRAGDQLSSRGSRWPHRGEG